MCETIPEDRRQLFRSYIDAAREKLEDNWCQPAKWALFRIDGTYYLPITATLREEPSLDRAHNVTTLDRAGIPTCELARVSGEVDTTKRTYHAIESIRATGVEPLAEGDIEEGSGYPGFLIDGDVSHLG